MTVNEIFVVLLQGLFVTGIVIDPQDPDTSASVRVHCLSSNKPIQIKDPFIPSLFNDSKFIAMEWYQLRLNKAGDVVKEVLLLSFMADETRISMPRKFSVFEFWGLQINNVDLSDSATYRAILLLLSRRQEWSVKIVVAGELQKRIIAVNIEMLPATIHCQG